MLISHISHLPDEKENCKITNLYRVQDHLIKNFHYLVIRFEIDEEKKCRNMAQRDYEKMTLNHIVS